jgi:hypothetical protein
MNAAALSFNNLALPGAVRTCAATASKKSKKQQLI